MSERRNVNVQASRAVWGSMAQGSPSEHAANIGA